LRMFPPEAAYVGVDIVDGPGVDVVVPAFREWGPPDVDGYFDVVVCTNVLEHCPPGDCVNILKSARNVLNPGGTLILQAAGEGFQVHSGRSATLTLEPGEHYANITRPMLDGYLREAGFHPVNYRITDPSGWPQDITAVARATSMTLPEVLAVESSSSDFVVLEAEQFERLGLDPGDEVVPVWRLHIDRQ